MNRAGLCKIFVLWMIAGCCIPACAAAGLQHELTIRLDPEAQRLHGHDQILWNPADQNSLHLRLTPRAVITGVTVQGRPAPYRFSQGRLSLSKPPEVQGPVRLVVDYEAVFDDAFPEAPANTDNPGYGVTGIVSAQGTFLLAGAGWYPRGEMPASRIALSVVAPAGVVAVTAGRFLGHETRDGATRSRLVVRRPTEGLALSAGRYVVIQRDFDGIQLAAFFLPQTVPLADRYLAAAERYIKLYTDRFGPYPFEKFAIVENFFPTGYGFPSYTLMGGTVLRLPFIVDVSLGHEIAHCWWGNGVQVNYAAGNWSEGLTTYVADHYYQELQSAEAARDYRRQWLRNYAALTDRASDFALSRFVSRVDPVTKVVGYDKSAMLFHMLRRLLGEEAFWGGLADLYARRLFAPTDWQDFRRVFAANAGSGLEIDLADFFDQWVSRAGAPDLRLDAVRRSPRAKGWQVSGRVAQRAPFFKLPLTLGIETESGFEKQSLILTDESADFTVQTAAKPHRVVVDPDVDLFRRLHPKEIPPTVNTIKGAGTVSVVLARGSGETGRRTARMLVNALGLSRAHVVEEERLQESPGRERTRIFIGWPADESLVPVPPLPVRLTGGTVSVEGRGYASPTDTFFGVIADPRHPEGVTAVLAPLHPDFSPQVARKVTHYGKYSYLIFQEGQNREKGTWPVTESPLNFRWDDSPLAGPE